MGKVYVVYYKVWEKSKYCNFEVESIKTEAFKDEREAMNRAEEISSDLIGINECEVK